MLFSLLIFVVVFVIYLLGVSPSVYAGDSGDIILAAWFGGVAHPPGYPLNSMIGWVFTHMPYNATIAFKANLMASFFLAGVVVVTFLCVYKLTKNRFVALASALMLAFNPLFWLYAHIIEVFQLNLFLVAVAVYFLIIWRDFALRKKPKNVFVYFSSFFLGLAVFHHHTSLLLIPGFLYLIIKTNRNFLKERRSLFRFVCFFLLGFIQYAFIPLAILSDSPASWDNIDSFKSFVRLITRSDYGTFVAIGNLLGADFKDRFFQLLNYFLFIKADFGVGLILIVTGMVFTFTKERTLFWFIFLLTLMTGPFFLFYSSFPTVNNFYSGLWERFILITYFFLSLYLGFGFLFYYNLLVGYFSRISKRKSFISSFRTAFVLFLFILPLYFFRANFYKADLRDFKLGDYVGYDILLSAEPKAIIFLLGDTVGFNTEYIYFTNPEFNDRSIIRAGSLNRLAYRRQIAKNYPHLLYPDDFLLDRKDLNYFQLLVKKNEDQFPIYIAEKVRGLENEFSLTSSGLLQKLMNKDDYKLYSETEIISHVSEVNKRLKYSNDPHSVHYTNFLVDHLKEIYYLSLLDTAGELNSTGHTEQALEYYLSSIKILPDNKAAYEKLGEVYMAINKCEDARLNFEISFNIDNKDWRIAEILSSIYSECLNNDDKAKYYKEKARLLRGTFDSLDNL